MRVEDPTMRLIRPLIGAVIVVGDPRPQSGQHDVLLLYRCVLVRLPRPTLVVREAGGETRIQEDQLRALGRRSLHELAVATLDDPPLMLGQELHERLANGLGRTQYRDLIWLPDDGV
jgi:hypothetical protein